MIPKKFTESGQALVVIALAAVVLFGFTALAIDGSAKFSDRRHAQNAADTAALAGALAYVNEDPDWKLDARGRASDNGYTGGLVNDTVWVYQCNDSNRTAAPLNCGAYEGNEDYIEVVILSHVNTTFARVFGWDQFDNLVQAVTFAKKGGNLADGAMVISYDPSPNCSTSGTGGYSVSVSGATTVNLNGGGIFMNSDEVCGFTIPNCADLNITGGGGINTVGSANINTTGCTFDPPLSNNFNQDPIVIPDDVYWPDVPPECSQTPQTPVKLGTVMAGSPPKNTEEWLIYPGFYTDFPSPSLVANKSHIYMASGVFCIDPPMNQDLSWSPIDAAILNGSTESNPSKNNYNKYHAQNLDGVTLYIKSGGGFSINSNNPTYLDASTDGDYQGYLVILEGTHTSHPSCSISGGSDIHLDGLIFAPYCNITVNGDSSSIAPINAQLIGWDIKINGGAGINFNYDPSNLVKIKRKVGLMR